MHGSLDVIMNLFWIFLAAQVAAGIAGKISLPVVAGQIIAGCIVGPYALGLVQLDVVSESLSEIGVVFLLFVVGVETRLAELQKVGKVAFKTAVLGVVLPFIGGALWGWYETQQSMKALFIGTLFVATSAGITASVLKEMGALQRLESRVILGAAIIDDILAMLLVGVIGSLQTEGHLEIFGLIVTFIEALLFLFIFGYGGTRLIKRAPQLLDRPVEPLSPLAISLLVCLGLAAAASWVGLAAIVGAFVAGAIVSESNQQELIEKQMQPVLLFFMPFFFVVTGAKLDVSVFADPSMYLMIGVVTVLAIITKLLGCGWGSISLGKRSAVIIGTGMVPRGEVGIVVATLGLQFGVLDGVLYAAVIAMSLLTTILTPPVLKRLLHSPEGQ